MNLQILSIPCGPELRDFASSQWFLQAHLPHGKNRLEEILALTTFCPYLLPLTEIGVGEGNGEEGTAQPFLVGRVCRVHSGGVIFLQLSVGMVSTTKA